MKTKLILIFIFGMFLISFISASDLDIELKPHYFKDGREVLPTSNISFTDISFEIIGKNNLENSRIMKLQIVDSYPITFKNALPNITIDFLRIKQTKTLWISQIIDIKNLKQFNQTNTNLFVGISGINEKTSEQYYEEAHLNLSVPKLEKKEASSTLFQKIGGLIWEDNEFAGFLIFILIIFFIGFFLWKFKTSKRLSKWRDRAEEERYERRLEKEEGH